MKFLAKVAAPVAVLALLAGCSRGPDVAFSVNGETTRLDAVEQAVEACSPILQVKGREARVAMANALLHGQVVDQLTRTTSLVVSDQDIQQVLTSPQGFGIDPRQVNKDCLPAVEGDAAWVVATGRLGQQALNEAVAKVDVTTNPVLGAQDPKTKMITSASSSMSEPGAVYGQDVAAR